MSFSSFLRRSAPMVLALSLVTVASCSDDTTTEVQTFPLEVRVEYPASYASVSAAGAAVTLTSSAQGTSVQAVADAQGVARFERVLPGTYLLSATRSLTADEAFALTGQRTALTLNANLPSITVQSATTTPPVLALAGSRLGDLLIREVYYTGSRTPSGGTYFSDQFTEIYNNSTETIYADGLLIADLYGPAGQINPTTVPTPFQSDPQHVYVSSVWQIPGNGTQHPIAPGKSIVIAQDGIDHRTDPNGNPSSPVNLAAADFETYNERPDERDLDAPGVPNLTRIVHRGGFDWLQPVFGPGVVIFRVPNVAALDTALVPGTSQTYTTKVPVAAVIDAFEALQNGNSAAYKRVPASLDAGFVFASGTYVSEAARRKVASTVGSRKVLQDTNNSSNDFVIVTNPTPRFAYP